MEHMHRTPIATTPPRLRSSLGHVLVVSLTALSGLLVVSLSLGTAFIAFRTNDVPPFDWRLGLNEQHGLTLHHGPVCVPMPGIADGACADYVPDLHEFSLRYDTANTHQVLVSVIVPVR